MIPFICQRFFFKDFLKSFFVKDIDDELKRILEETFVNKEIFYTNCAKTSLYAALAVLKNNSVRSKVILPAYTDSGLVAVIKKARLTPILCDNSLKDFNLDLEKAKLLLNNDVLAVISPCMFGVPQDLEEFNKFCFERGIYLIEDFAQGFGSSFKGKAVGNYSHFSFTSLARGKNVSTYSGGILFVDKEFALDIRREIDKLAKPCLLIALRDFILYQLVCILSHPAVYSFIGIFVSGFKKQKPVFDFKLGRMPQFKKHLLYANLLNLNKLVLPKINFGKQLYLQLKDKKDQVLIPQISEEMEVCYNRFPVIIKDKKKLLLCREELNRAGIEANCFYGKTLFDFYPELVQLRNKSEFINAKMLADNLLVFPVNCFMNKKNLERIVSIL
ncbi:MAG: DegT/DnrJ/EryC1/StrS aminotransferase family protein [Candidatus Omnitrophica bacterium]|nr:DegT/DnrJ/EryC1/StrS aminotransferase family protein [Candidatus Omnitrophota bacterium]